MTTFLPVTDSRFARTAIVDLKTRAVGLAYRLGSLTHFLDAAQELQTFRRLSATKFRRQGRKIVALIEIARKTLTAAGIALYLFNSCSVTSAPYKDAYIELLRTLKQRRHNAEPALQGRIKTLLLTLSLGFTIQRRGDPSFRLLPSASRASPVWERRAQTGPTTPQLRPGTLIQEHISSMPPPDAFVILPSHPRNKRAQIWNPDIYRPPRRQSPELEQENISPPRFLRPLPGRFGIFFTAKKSMHRPRERAGRLKAPRPPSRQ